MDCRVQTFEHIHEVQKLLAQVIKIIIGKQLEHDRSKLYSPELEIYNEYTEELAGCEYGSNEYKRNLAAMRPALEHHYKNNQHHPEHWPNGIKDMSLVDLLEMICDWMAATKRHQSGDIFKSIEINQKRFGYSDELKSIFLNTVKEIID